MTVILTFLFHTGSIKSPLIDYSEIVKIGFYSILVRLKARRFFSHRFHRVSVSIPYWFD